MPEQEFELACQRFESSLAAGERPRIEDFLGQIEVADRDRLLGELILLEVDSRRRREKVNPDEYRKRFPQQQRSVGWAFLDLCLRDARKDRAGNLKATMKLGDYDIIDHAGTGGMGLVLKGRHRKLLTIRALKTPLRDIAFEGGELTTKGKNEQMDREVRLLMKINHPNIVKIHNYFDAIGLTFIAMDYVNGDDLENYVKKNHPIPVDQACRIIRDAANALDYIHQKGILHLDIKPSNLMIDKSGRTILTDFGLARHEADQVIIDGNTKAYTGPERLVYPFSATARSDIYSLGGTFYFLLTGRDPIEGRIAPIGESREDASFLMPLIEKMMHKRPSKRYQKASDVINELNQYLRMMREPPPEPAPSNRFNTSEVQRRKKLTKDALYWSVVGVFIASLMIVFAKPSLVVQPSSPHPVPEKKGPAPRRDVTNEMEINIDRQNAFADYYKLNGKRGKVYFMAIEKPEFVGAATFEQTLTVTMKLTKPLQGVQFFGLDADAVTLDYISEDGKSYKIEHAAGKERTFSSRGTLFVRIMNIGSIKGFELPFDK